MAASDKENGDKIIHLAQSSGMSKEEFREAIAELYAGMIDMEMDDNPDLVFEQTSVFDGHKLVIECRREFLN